MLAPHFTCTSVPSLTKSPSGSQQQHFPTTERRHTTKAINSNHKSQTKPSLSVTPQAQHKTMEEEPWDELCGPPPSIGSVQSEDDRSIGASLVAADATTMDATTDVPLVRKKNHGPSVPPPMAAFSPQKPFLQDPPSVYDDEASVGSSRSNKDYYAAAIATATATPPPYHNSSLGAARSVSDDGDDEDEYEEDSVRSLPNDAYSIRQEALKMLEVADDQLSGSAYSVHRTVSGGFMATHKTLGSQKRVPSALAGLKYTATRTRSSYRDDPYAMTEDTAGTASTREARQAYEYGDENVVDVVAMERRNSSYAPTHSSSGNNSNSNSNNNNNRWSSRYSIDTTLLAMSGGSTSTNNRRFLDSMDHTHQRERQAARNLFSSSPEETRSTGVFGSGYSFRNKYVFGRQGVTVPPSPTAEDRQNLRSAYIDQAESSLPPPSMRKTWQEQFLQKQKRRRLYVVAAAVLLIFIITLASTLGSQSAKASKATSSVVVGGTAPSDAVTFYATSDVPYDDSDQDRLANDLTLLDTQASFLIHLGNIQQAAITLCAPSRYQDVASILEESPIATLIIPGEEDWANCPDPDAAWDAWDQNFQYFSNNFFHSFEVSHQPVRTENIATTVSGVFFAGVHVVGGRLYSDEERAKRNGQNFEWIKEMVTHQAKDARAVVIFGNARPGSAANSAFFNSMASFLKLYGLPTLYVHASSTGGVLDVYQPFEGVDNVVAIQVPQGGLNPPARISVGSGSTPFFVN